MKLPAYEDLAPLLERVALQQSLSSEEYRTLDLAAHALFYALLHHREDFEQFVAHMRSELSEEEKAHLQSLGIDPDAGEEDE